MVSASGPSAASKVFGMSKFLCSSVYWRHSVIKCLTESSVPQEMHLGFSPFSIYKTGVAGAESVYNYFILYIWREIWPAEDCVFYHKTALISI